MSLDRLSPRERQCLERAAYRTPYKKISADLDIEVATIDGYLTSAARKLGVSRDEAFKLVLFGDPPENAGRAKPGVDLDTGAGPIDERSQFVRSFVDWIGQEKKLTPLQTLAVIAFIAAMMLAAVALAISVAAILSHPR